MLIMHGSDISLKGMCHQLCYKAFSVHLILICLLVNYPSARKPVKQLGSQKPEAENYVYIC